MKKKILVDLSCSILHHGHIRLLKKASKFGEVIVALTTDREIKKNKGHFPELKYDFRKEILYSIKFVKKVIPSKWKITNTFLPYVRNKFIENRLITQLFAFFLNLWYRAPFPLRSLLVFLLLIWNNL